MLYGSLKSQAFSPQEDNDLITLNNFFVICRDIIGINTFEFEEEEYVPRQVELEVEEYDKDFSLNYMLEYSALKNVM